MNRIFSAGVGVVVGFSAFALTTPARAFDMDCKVILCLAGGFPSGCSDAHSYMIKRLKKLKPPFGICTAEGADGSGDTYDVPAKVFTRNIHPLCLTYAQSKDGQVCSTSIPGRQEGVINISIPASEDDEEDFSNDYVWWSRPWNPADDLK